MREKKNDKKMHLNQRSLNKERQLVMEGNKGGKSKEIFKQRSFPLVVDLVSRILDLIAEGPTHVCIFLL